MYKKTGYVALYVGVCRGERSLAHILEQLCRTWNGELVGLILFLALEGRNGSGWGKFLT